MSRTDIVKEWLGFLLAEAVLLAVANAYSGDWKHDRWAWVALAGAVLLALGVAYAKGLFAWLRRRILPTGWGRLGLVAWVAWVAWKWKDMDDGIPRAYGWKVDHILDLLGWGLVVPTILIAAAWWVLLGFRRDAPGGE